MEMLQIQFMLANMNRTHKAIFENMHKFITYAQTLLPSVEYNIPYKYDKWGWNTGRIFSWLHKSLECVITKIGHKPEEWEQEAWRKKVNHLQMYYFSTRSNMFFLSIYCFVLEPGRTKHLRNTLYLHQSVIVKLTTYV